MISLMIAAARKSPDRCNAGRWWVMHPSNDSILASCDTEEEADRVIELLSLVGRATSESGRTLRIVPYTPTMPTNEVRRVVCRKCLAPIGAPCKTAGVEMATHHRERHVQAVEFASRRR